MYIAQLILYKSRILYNCYCRIGKLGGKNGRGRGIGQDAPRAIKSQKFPKKTKRANKK